MTTENTVANTPAALTMLVEAFKLMQADTDARMDAKLDERLGDFQIDVDNVDGLERYMEREVETAVEKEVEKALEDYSVDADNVSDLDDFVNTRVDDKLNDFKVDVDVDSVDGLDDFVDERVADKVKEAMEDEGRKLAEALTAKVEAFLTPERVQEAVEAALATPKVQLLLANKMQEALVAAVSRFVGAAFTKAA